LRDQRKPRRVSGVNTIGVCIFIDAGLGDAARRRSGEASSERVRARARVGIVDAARTSEVDGYHS
jgi:dUTPase